MSLPAVSVVVAAWSGGDGVARALEALAPQRSDACEVIVVSAGGIPRALKVPWARFVEEPGERLVPELWGTGIARAAGDVVALTTTHFVVGPHWIAAVRDAHARLGGAAAPVHAIGGPLELPAGATVVDAAIFFQRYAPYLGHVAERDMPDLAGDNASYSRAALALYPGDVAAGFWELDLHRRLLGSGGRLVLTPAMRATQASSWGFWPFVAQRLRHGRQFGSSRSSSWSSGMRLVRAATLPLIPAVLLAKVVLRVRGSGHLGRCLRSLPALVPFVTAWAMGEVHGYLRPIPGSHP